MRLVKLFVVVCLLVAFSCKKDSDSVDVTPRFYFVYGGTSAASFARNLILFSSADTDTANIVVSSTYSLPKPATVTLSVAEDLVASYNAANGTNFEIMPEAAYSFATTFTAGDNNTVYDTIAVKIQKNLALSKNYLLPIKILSADGHKIDSASSVIYLHTSNNALSGLYNSHLIKKVYSGNSTTGTLVETVDTTLGKSLIPLNQDSSLLNYADLGSNGWMYILKYDANVKKLIVEANNIMKASIQPDSFKVLDSIYNPPSTQIYLKTSYKNLSGDERIVEETLTLQP